MNDYGRIAKELITRNLGEARYEEICEQFGMNAADRELLNELISTWKPEYTLEDIITVCEAYSDRPNIGRVMMAWQAIASEVAQISEFRRLGSDN